MTDQPFGIKPDSIHGLPLLEFTGRGASASSKEVYEMFANLPPEQAEILRLSQHMLMDGALRMREIASLVRTDPDEKRAVDAFGMTPGAIEFLAEHGEMFVGVHMPHEVLGGRGLCFSNTLGKVREQENLDYVEGLAIPPVGDPMLHAWCADGSWRFWSDGKKYLAAIDYTWARADYARYFGIRIPKPAMDELRVVIRQDNPLGYGYGFLGPTNWSDKVKRVLEKCASQQHNEAV
jgi:hypothetical protein